MCACRCGIRVHLRDGKVRHIEGNPAHPLNKGVICAKGAAGAMKQDSPARLTRPLRRKAGAARGEGAFEPISWDEAYALLEEETRQASPLADARNIKLVFGRPDPPIWLRADRIKWGRGLGHLLSNAFKFSDSGTVRSTARQWDDGAGRVGVSAILLIGILVMTGGLSWFGHLPGDIRIEKTNARVYIPVASCLLISVAVSVIVYIVRRLTG